jgi:hypothetical protein
MGCLGTCKFDYQCGGGVAMPQIVKPVGCAVPRCTSGTCQTAYEDCGDFKRCCAGQGCVPLNTVCGIQNQ